MSRLGLSVLLVCAFAVGCFAEEETVRFGTIVTEKATVLKSHPRNGGQTLATIPAGTTLQWLEGRRRKNWLRVVAAKGGEGWVPAKTVKIVTQSPPAPRAQETLAAAKCEPNLNACPVNGCETEGTPHAAMNESKRAAATGVPVTISFSDLAALQQAADAVVTQGQDIPDRSVIQNLTVGSATLGEGTAVQVAAFLSIDTPGPHPNTGESVNCNLRGSANNDFHIPVTEEAQQTEYDGIVVEMIPQSRNSAWSIAHLKSLQTKQTQVKVVGKLFYDNLHVVNSDPNNPLPSQPKRFALWEIHPISQFLVCNNGTGCDVNSDDDWTALEDR